MSKITRKRGRRSPPSKRIKERARIIRERLKQEEESKKHQDMDTSLPEEEPPKKRMKLDGCTRIDPCNMGLSVDSLPDLNGPIPKTSTPIINHQQRNNVPLWVREELARTMQSPQSQSSSQQSNPPSPSSSVNVLNAPTNNATQGHPIKTETIATATPIISNLTTSSLPNAHTPLTEPQHGNNVPLWLRPELAGAMQWLQSQSPSQQSNLLSWASSINVLNATTNNGTQGYSIKTETTVTATAIPNMSNITSSLPNAQLTESQMDKIMDKIIEDTTDHKLINALPKPKMNININIKQCHDTKIKLESSESSIPPLVAVKTAFHQTNTSSCNTATYDSTLSLSDMPSLKSVVPPLFNPDTVKCNDRIPTKDLKDVSKLNFASMPDVTHNKDGLDRKQTEMNMDTRNCIKLKYGSSRYSKPNPAWKIERNADGTRYKVTFAGLSPSKMMEIKEIVDKINKYPILGHPSLQTNQTVSAILSMSKSELESCFQ